MKCECGDNIEPWYIRVYSKITYECKECGIQELDDREYYEDHYPNDIYRKSSGLHPNPEIGNVLNIRINMLTFLSKT